ncbi:hypothetical protein V8D89_003488 [Ganoderma adspersum]
MESFDNMTSIVGSRRPIFLPAFSDNSSSSSHTPTPPSALSSATSPVSSSRSRRKPAYAFKSPSAADERELGEWEAHHPPRTSSTGKRASPPYERRRGSASTDASRSSAHKYSPSVKSAVQRHAPLLPLYHPLGPLAQSLPKLDPGLFGLPSSLSIEDGEDQPDGEADPRSTSRSRRAGPKGREDDGQSNGTPNGVDKAAQDATGRERNPSPRKRRGGGGTKRKRKDAEDADGVFPPPAKRTRNPRGAAANSSVPAAPSPLVGPAVVASDLAEDVVTENGGASADAEEAEEAQEEPEVQQTPKRSARTRKPRATRPAKRRDSSGSASAASSVSVSIAAATRAAAAAPRPALPEEDGIAAEPEPQPEAEPQPEPELRPELRTSEPPPQAPQPVVNGVGAHGEADSGRPSDIPSSTRSPIEKPTASGQKEKPQQASPAGYAPHTVDPSRPVAKDTPANGVTHNPGPRNMSQLPTSAAPPPLSPPAPPAQPRKEPPPPRAPPQKEEREEGELSD